MGNGKAIVKISFLLYYKTKMSKCQLGQLICNWRERTGEKGICRR